MVKFQMIILICFLLIIPLNTIQRYNISNESVARVEVQNQNRKLIMTPNLKSNTVIDPDLSFDHMIINMAEGEPGKSESDKPNENNVQQHADELQALEDMTLNPNVNIDHLVEEASSEYEHLNKTLDELDNWMTTIESRNDSLYSQLQELLQSSRETRLELQRMNETKEVNSESDIDKSPST